MGVAKEEGEREGAKVKLWRIRQGGREREKEREKNKKRWSNGGRCGEEKGRCRRGGSSEASEQ